MAFKSISLSTIEVIFKLFLHKGWGDGQAVCSTIDGTLQVFGDAEGGAPRPLISRSAHIYSRVYAGEHWNAVLTNE